MHRLALSCLLVACGTDRVPRDDGVIGPLDDAGLPIDVDASLAVDAPSPDPDGPPPDPDAPDPPLTLCEEAELHSDLAWIEARVLLPTCANGCHNAQNPYANLRLDAGLARAQLVNVPSSLRSGWTRVVPGQPNNSYLLVTLGHVSGPLPDLGLMPLNEPRLCTPILEAIERWIAAGAP
jgi:hypothetical protein